MSEEAFFASARILKREVTGEPLAGLTQAEVDALKAVISRWQPKAPSNPTALSDAAAFFAKVRTLFGSLDQSQVNGFQRLLQAYGVARWPIAFAAYGLATAWRETASRMQPVKEAYFLGSKADAYLKTLSYYPWFGRGDVQLTWEGNYKRADKELDLNGALIANPDLALDPIISARIMVKGMEQGWFTRKKLADYLPLSGKASFDAYTQARRIINGLDHAQEIAKNAQSFETALISGGWK